MGIVNIILTVLTVALPLIGIIIVWVGLSRDSFRTIVAGGIVGASLVFPLVAALVISNPAL